MVDRLKKNIFYSSRLKTWLQEYLNRKSKNIRKITENQFSITDQLNQIYHHVSFVIVKFGKNPENENNHPERILSALKKTPSDPTHRHTVRTGLQRKTSEKKTSK